MALSNVKDGLTNGTYDDESRGALEPVKQALHTLRVDMLHDAQANKALRSAILAEHRSLTGKALRPKQSLTLAHFQVYRELYRDLIQMQQTALALEKELVARKEARLHADVMEKMTALDEANSTLEQNLSHALREVDSLRYQLSTVTKPYEERIDQLKQEVDSSVQKSSQLQKEVAEASVHGMDLARQLDAAHDKFDEMKAAWEASTDRERLLMSDLEGLEGRLSRAHSLSFTILAKRSRSMLLKDCFAYWKYQHTLSQQSTAWLHLQHMRRNCAHVLFQWKEGVREKRLLRTAVKKLHTLHITMTQRRVLSVWKKAAVCVRNGKAEMTSVRRRRVLAAIFRFWRRGAAGRWRRRRDLARFAVFRTRRKVVELLQEWRHALEQRRCAEVVFSALSRRWQLATYRTSLVRWRTIAHEMSWRRAQAVSRGHHVRVALLSRIWSLWRVFTGGQTHLQREFVRLERSRETRVLSTAFRGWRDVWLESRGTEWGAKVIARGYNRRVLLLRSLFRWTSITAQARRARLQQTLDALASSLDAHTQSQMSVTEMESRVLQFVRERTNLDRRCAVLEIVENRLAQFSSDQKTIQIMLRIFIAWSQWAKRSRHLRRAGLAVRSSRCRGVTRAAFDVWRTSRDGAQLDALVEANSTLMTHLTAAQDERTRLAEHLNQLQSKLNEIKPPPDSLHPSFRISSHKNAPVRRDSLPSLTIDPPTPDLDSWEYTMSSSGRRVR